MLGFGLWQAMSCSSFSVWSRRIHVWGFPGSCGVGNFIFQGQIFAFVGECLTQNGFKIVLKASLIYRCSAKWLIEAENLSSGTGLWAIWKSQFCEFLNYCTLLTRNRDQVYNTSNTTSYKSYRTAETDNFHVHWHHRKFASFDADRREGGKVLVKKTWHHTGITPASHRHHTGIPPASHRHHTAITPASHRHHTGIPPASHRHHTAITPASHRHHTGIPPASHRHPTGIPPASHRHHTGIPPASHRHHTSITPASHCIGFERNNCFELNFLFRSLNWTLLQIYSVIRIFT